MWRCHVSCPQADVLCTYGALYVAKPRWLFYVVAQRARLVALAGLVVLGAAGPLVRLKVRGERLKAGSFYRFALKLILVYSVECCLRL